MTASEAGPPALEALLESVANRLGPAAVLSASDLPELPRALAFESVVVTKSVMGYTGGFGLAEGRDEGGYYRADVLKFYSSRRGYLALAAALTCVLLDRAEQGTDILLTNRNSQIKALHLQRIQPDCAELGLTVSPTAFEPKLDRQAAMDALVRLDDIEKPRFLLTHRDDLTDLQQPWEARDHVRLASSAIGLVLLTSALIDYALNGRPVRELSCRAPPLVGSDVLGMCSAEAYFWLPGSFAWPCESPDGE